VLRAVGEHGLGETGVLGIACAAVMGDLRERDGRVEACAAVEMLSESLGFIERDASILAVMWVG
jgi:hypothetical protein